MVRQISREPFVPGLVDSVNRGQLRIRSFWVFDKGNDPEVDAGEMRIRAKMVANDQFPIGFKGAECFLEFGKIYV